MDVVALFQYGVTQAVATLGTATTPDHAELLFRNARRRVLLFRRRPRRPRRRVEGAGIGAAAHEDGRQAFFLFLPDGEDPDTHRAQGRRGRFRRAPARGDAAVASSSSTSCRKDVNLATLDGKARLAERAKPLLAQIPDGAFRDLMQQRLTELTGVGARAAGAAGAGHAVDARRMRAARRRRSAAWCARAIALLLQQPALARRCEPPYLLRACCASRASRCWSELIALVRERPGHRHRRDARTFRRARRRRGAAEAGDAEFPRRRRDVARRIPRCA